MNIYCCQYCSKNISIDTKEKDVKKEKFKLIVLIIIALSIVVRIIYVIKTPYMEKQHDIEPMGNGLDYIDEIYENGKLPRG